MKILPPSEASATLITAMPKINSYLWFMKQGGMHPAVAVILENTNTPLSVPAFGAWQESVGHHQRLRAYAFEHDDKSEKIAR